MAGCVGKMDAFDSTVEDWATYIERFEQCSLTDKIEDFLFLYFFFYCFLVQTNTHITAHHTYIFTILYTKK